MRYEIVPVSPTHIGPLVSRLGAQREQIEALGERPREWIRLLLQQSRIAWTVLVDDRPVVIWGVKCTLSSAEADVWLAITDFAREHVRPLVKGTRAELDKLLETRVALNTVVSTKDERALRWCQFLGFKVIGYGRDEATGVLHHKLRLTKSEPRLHPPFIVLGLPRSRTAWLARFLTYGKSTCLHEMSVTMRSVKDAIRLFETPNMGSSETAMAPGWYLLRHYFPDIKVVVVRRPVDEVMNAVTKLDFGFPVTFDERRRRLDIERLDRDLARVSGRNVITVNFHDLHDEDVCRCVFEHCLPYEFDETWWESLRDANVQSDVNIMMRYSLENRPGISTFKRDCWRDLRRIARG